MRLETRLARRRVSVCFVLSCVRVMRMWVLQTLWRDCGAVLEAMKQVCDGRAAPRCCLSEGWVACVCMWLRARLYVFMCMCVHVHTRAPAFFVVRIPSELVA
jgi:hypothetical protein